MKKRKIFLDAIASPSSYPCQWVSELVIVSGVMLSHLRALRACFSTDKIQFLHTTEFFSTGTSCGKYEGTLGCSQKVHPAKENTHLCLRKRKHTHLAQKAEQAKQCNNGQQRDSNLLLLFSGSHVRPDQANFVFYIFQICRQLVSPGCDFYLFDFLVYLFCISSNCILYFIFFRYVTSMCLLTVTFVFFIFEFLCFVCCISSNCILYFIKLYFVF